MTKCLFEIAEIFDRHQVAAVNVPRDNPCSRQLMITHGLFQFVEHVKEPLHSEGFKLTWNQDFSAGQQRCLGDWSVAWCVIEEYKVTSTHLPHRITQGVVGIATSMDVGRSNVEVAIRSESHTDPVVLAGSPSPINLTLQKMGQRRWLIRWQADYCCWPGDHNR